MRVANPYNFKFSREGMFFPPTFLPPRKKEELNILFYLVNTMISEGVVSSTRWSRKTPPKECYSSCNVFQSYSKWRKVFHISILQFKVHALSQGGRAKEILAYIINEKVPKFYLKACKFCDQFSPSRLPKVL